MGRYGAFFDRVWPPHILTETRAVPPMNASLALTLLEDKLSALEATSAAQASASNVWWLTSNGLVVRAPPPRIKYLKRDTGLIARCLPALRRSFSCNAASACSRRVASPHG